MLTISTDWETLSKPFGLGQCDCGESNGDNFNWGNSFCQSEIEFEILTFFLKSRPVFGKCFLKIEIGSKCRMDSFGRGLSILVYSNIQQKIGKNINSTL